MKKSNLFDGLPLSYFPGYGNLVPPYRRGGPAMPFFTKRSRDDSRRVLNLPIDEIMPNPNQPRRVFDPQGLEELAASIRSLGILQPLTVRRREEGWELIAGERRLRAAALAGLKEVPCLQLQANGQESSLISLVENLQRRDLDFVEEARAISRLLSVYHLSQEETARRIGKSQSAVANKLRLLRLPPEVLESLRDDGFTERHARALLRLEDDPRLRDVVEYIRKNRLTVSMTEQYIDSLLAPPPPGKPRTTYIIKDIRLFLNTITRGLNIMRSAGVDACCNREDTDDTICLTIRIPK